MLMTFVGEGQSIFDLIKTNKNIRKFKFQCFSLKMVDVENINLFTIVYFSDTSFSNLRDNSSQSGYVILLNKNNKLFSPIPAETIALKQILEACFMIKSFICEIMYRELSEQFLPIKCYVYNKYLTDYIYSTKTVTEKRLKTDICAVRGMIAKKEVTSIGWCKSELKIADCLTKGTPKCMKFLNSVKGNTGLLEQFQNVKNIFSFNIILIKKGIYSKYI